MSGQLPGIRIKWFDLSRTERAWKRWKAWDDDIERWERTFARGLDAEQIDAAMKSYFAIEAIIIECVHIAYARDSADRNTLSDARLISMQRIGAFVADWRRFHGS